MSDKAVVPVAQQVIEHTGGDQIRSIAMPIITPQMAMARYDAVRSYMREIFQEGTHFGSIPGTPKKKIRLPDGKIEEIETKVLYKPGAESLCAFFGLSPLFRLEESVYDWTGKDHGGEPLFYMRYSCTLSKNDVIVGHAEGSANSWETKYRYRWVEEQQLPRHMRLKKDELWSEDRTKTVFEADFALNKKETTGKYGKPAEYWLQWEEAIRSGKAKKTRKTLGTREFDGYETSIGAVKYRIPNQDLGDVVNTLEKMSQKRSLVASVLIATGISDMFTQDLDDIDTRSHVGTETPDDRRHPEPETDPEPEPQGRHDQGDEPPPDKRRQEREPEPEPKQQPRRTEQPKPAQEQKGTDPYAVGRKPDTPKTEEKPKPAPAAADNGPASDAAMTDHIQKTMLTTAGKLGAIPSGEKPGLIVNRFACGYFGTEKLLAGKLPNWPTWKACLAAMTRAVLADKERMVSGPRELGSEYAARDKDAAGSAQQKPTEPKPQPKPQPEPEPEPKPKPKPDNGQPQGERRRYEQPELRDIANDDLVKFDGSMTSAQQVQTLELDRYPGMVRPNMGLALQLANQNFIGTAAAFDGFLTKSLMAAAPAPDLAVFLMWCICFFREARKLAENKRMYVGENGTVPSFTDIVTDFRRWAGIAEENPKDIDPVRYDIPKLVDDYLDGKPSPVK